MPAAARRAPENSQPGYPVCDPLAVNAMGDDAGPARTLPWWRRSDLLPLAWVVVTVIVWGARGFSAALYRDAGFYVYAGQQVAAGNAPYVEVFNRAGPYASLLPGLGVELGRLVGISDTLGARLLFFAMVAFTPALMYLTGRDLFRSRLAGCTAAATLLGFGVIARLATGGPESKIALVTGLSVGLLLLVRRRWLLAGIATGLVTLTWQPGLFALAPAAAVLVVLSGGSLRDRATRALWYGGGGLLALAVTVGGFALAGATEQFVEGFYTANTYSTQQGSVIDHPRRVVEHLQASFGWGFWVFAFGNLAALALGAGAWWLRRSAPRQAANQVMLAVSCLGGLVWTGWFAFDRAPDTVPLLPAAALGVGGVAGVLAHLVRRAASPLPRRILLGAVAAWMVIAVVTISLHTVSLRTDNLQKQQASSDAVFDNLPPDATVFTYEVPQPLALTGRKSISRYVIFDQGLLRFIGDQEPGGVRGYVNRLIEAEPDVVLIASRAPFRVVKRVLRPYKRVGFGPDWKVFVRRDLDAETQNRIAEDLVAAREEFAE